MPWNTTVFDSTGKIDDARMKFVSGAVALGVAVASGTAALSAPSATEWVGIPDPSDTLGYDVFQDEIADPGNWPGAEAIGNYYIDSGHGSATDSGNTYGYPDLPRNTIPTSPTVDGGNKMVVVGDGESYSGGTITASGTCSASAGDQGWVVGRSAVDITIKTNRPILNDRSIALGSQFMILDGFWVKEQNRDGAVNSNTNNNILRNFELEGDAIEQGNNGAAVQVNSNCVVYNAEIHDQGIPNTNSNNDLHGIKHAGSTNNVWYLNITGYNIQGDTIQIGDAGGVAANVHHTYIGNCISHDNKENSIDTKDCTDVIISGGEGYNMSNVWGDDEGADVVTHDESNYVWIINRKSHDCTRGISIAGDSTNTFVLSCEFKDITTAGDAGGAYFDPGVAVSAQRNEVTIAYNTFHNCRKAIEATVGINGSELNIIGNIFHARNTSETNNWDIGIENSSDVSAATVDYNMYDDGAGGRFYQETTYRESLSAWVANTSHDDNSSEDDPLFTNEGADDFTLQSGSPALAAGDPSKPAAYATFLSRYGIDIETDLNGEDRPASGTDWDLGAYERP